MFCDACGATLQGGQQFCTRCGKALVGPVVAGGGRVARHAHLLGVLWIAYSVLVMMVACVMFIVSHTVFGHFGPTGPPGFVRPLLSLLAVLVAAKGIAGIFAGVGLLQRQPWARVLTIVLGVIGLFSMPFGTALGIYTLWVLLSPNADVEFKQLSVASG